MAIVLTAYPSSLEITQGEHVLEGGIRVYDVEFRFPEGDATWEGMALVGVFKTNLGEWAAFLDLETHCCKIPWEALDEGSAGSSLSVGLYGVKEDDPSIIVRSTVWADMPFRILPGPDAEPTRDPTPSIFQSILSEVSKVVQRITIIQTIEKTVTNLAAQVKLLREETGADAKTAQNSADAAQTSARSAGASADSSARSAAEADISAREAATSRQGAEDALALAETARKAAQDAAGSAGESADSALSSADEAVKAQTAAETAKTEAQQALADTQEAAQTAAEDADRAAAVLEQVNALGDEAADNALLAESWAVGGTGIREGEDVDNAKYYARRAKNIVGGIDIVIGDAMPAIWPVLWFDTGGVTQPGDNEMLLVLGDWTEESVIQAELEGEVYAVENAVLNGEPTEGTYSFDVI